MVEREAVMLSFAAEQHQVAELVHRAQARSHKEQRVQIHHHQPQEELLRALVSLPALRPSAQKGACQPTTTAFRAE